MEPEHEAAPAPRSGPALAGCRGSGRSRRRQPGAVRGGKAARTCPGRRGGPRQSPPSPSRSGKPRLGPRRHRQVIELRRGAAPARLRRRHPPLSRLRLRAFPPSAAASARGAERAAAPLVVTGLLAPAPARGPPPKSSAGPSRLREPRHGISTDFSFWEVWWCLSLACGPRQLKHSPRVRCLPRQCHSGVQSRCSWFSCVIWECRDEAGDHCEDFYIKH